MIYTVQCLMSNKHADFIYLCLVTYNHSSMFFKVLTLESSGPCILNAGEIVHKGVKIGPWGQQNLYSFYVYSMDRHIVHHMIRGVSVIFESHGGVWWAEQCLKGLFVRVHNEKKSEKHWSRQWFLGGSESESPGNPLKNTHARGNPTPHTAAEAGGLENRKWSQSKDTDIANVPQEHEPRPTPHLTTTALHHSTHTNVALNIFFKFLLWKCLHESSLKKITF